MNLFIEAGREILGWAVRHPEQVAWTVFYTFFAGVIGYNLYRARYPSNRSNLARKSKLQKPSP